jgi:hypothetical protein
MDFRAAARNASSGLSSDLAMDPTMEDAKDPLRTQYGQPDPTTDGADPATSAGASPYNGAPPFGAPVTSDSEWLDPQTQVDGPTQRGAPVPHTTGPHVDQTTLHDARRQSYEDKAARYGAR